MKRMLLLLIGVASVGGSIARSDQEAASLPERRAIEATANSFVQAYNAADAKAIAALWTEDAEYNLGQLTVKGRPAIQRLYEGFLSAHPGSKMDVQIASIRFLAPTVAVEQGVATVRGSTHGPASASAYTAVHVRQQDGKWRMASVRESEASPIAAEEELKDLTWLVGTWKSNEDGAHLEVTYEWIENKHFLRGTTIIHAGQDPAGTPGGLQIIGKDSLTGQITSWFFNTDGGHGYGTWSKDGARWRIRAHGATAEGATTSATNILYQADDKVLSWQSIDRTLGNQRLPNTPEIVAERVGKDVPTKP